MVLFGLPMQSARTTEVWRAVKIGAGSLPLAWSFSRGPREKLHANGKDPAPIFTARQTSVVRALCMGKPNKTIAHELNMRESTVKVHVRNIMKKLSARNRTEVALIAKGLPL